MADFRQISEKYAELAHEVLWENEELTYIRVSNVTITYLSSTHEKKKAGNLVLGQCEKVADKYKWGIPCDFTITIFEPNVKGMTDDQLKILLFHELLHVGIEETEDGEESYSVKPHDLEDFKLIIDKFGTDWAKLDVPFTN